MRRCEFIRTRGFHLDFCSNEFEPTNRLRRSRMMKAPLYDRSGFQPQPEAIGFNRWSIHDDAPDSIAMCKAGAIPVTSCPRVAWFIISPPLLDVIDCRRVTQPTL